MAAPSPTAPAGAIPLGRVTITEADSGKTFSVAMGATINLALRAPQGFQDWQVATPDPLVLVPTVNPAAAAARGVTLRAFRAVAVGQTAIMATSMPVCTPGQACPQIVRAFKVTVAVTA
jgi:hypothetical protein